MPLIPQPILDYSDKDFASLRLRLQGLARSVFPEWTDFNQANYGNLLLEMFAYVGDMLSFYQDAQAREHFWPTMARRISAIRLGRHINFTLPGSTPATGTARISIPAAIGVNIAIPPGTRMRSLDPYDPIPFRTTNVETVFLTAGNTFVDVPIEQTEVIANEVYESSGAPNQEFVLSRIPYIDGSVQAVAADGTYTAIDSFVNVASTNPRRFVALVDQNDRVHVRFGNGTLGKIPEGAISFSYKISRGGAGILEAGKLGVLVDTIFDVNGGNVSGVLVSNPTAITGGADRMTVAQARSLGPASLRALTRSITRADFETHALEIAGVARAAMLTSNEDPGVDENNGKLMLVARGAVLPSGRYRAATPTTALKNMVLQKVTVEKPGAITFKVEALEAPFKRIDVYTKVHFTSSNSTDKTITATNIAAALRDFFAATLEDGTPNPDIDFGANLLDDNGNPSGEVVWSSVFNAIRDVTGVRKIAETSDNVLLNSDPTRDPSQGARQSITIGLREFPTLNRIVIVDAVTLSTILSTTGDAV